jgi:hypothetical protein
MQSLLQLALIETLWITTYKVMMLEGRHSNSLAWPYEELRHYCTSKVFMSNFNSSHQRDLSCVACLINKTIIGIRC